MTSEDIPAPDGWPGPNIKSLQLPGEITIFLGESLIQSSKDI